MDEKLSSDGKKSECGTESRIDGKGTEYKNMKI